MQSRVAVCGSHHRGSSSEIALIVDGTGAGPDPTAMAAAHREIAGKPAVDRFIDTASCHTEAAGGASMAALPGGVALCFGQARQASTQYGQRLAAGRGQPVLRGTADRWPVGQVAPQLCGAEVVGVREAIEIRLDRFGVKRGDASG